MSFDAEELIAQQEKERKKAETRMALMRQWDAPTDRWIYLSGFVYAIVAFELRMLLAEFFNYQQMDPGRAAERGHIIDYIFINLSLVCLLGPFNKNLKTWKDMWKPVQYILAFAVYLFSSFLRFRFLPREFHEAQITQMFFITALTVDIIIILAYWIHTYFLYRRKYLPDCLFLVNHQPNLGSRLFYVAMLLILSLFTWVGRFIAPELPKFFH